MIEEHNETIQQIPAYALGSLTAEEAALLAQHLETCAACREELAAYTAVVDWLPLAVPLQDPPTHVKTLLLARIQGPAAAQTAAPIQPSPEPQTLPERLRRFLQGPYWRPALVFVLSLLLISIIFLWPRSVSSPAPVVELAPTGAAPAASGLLEFGGEGRAGTLTVSGQPLLPAEQQYQLWLIVDGRRASGAVFSVDAAGEASVAVQAERPLAEYGAFGITIEPAGGSPGPTGERVLGFNL